MAVQRAFADTKAVDSFSLTHISDLATRDECLSLGNSGVFQGIAGNPVSHLSAQPSDLSLALYRRVAVSVPRRLRRDGCARSEQEAGACSPPCDLLFRIGQSNPPASLIGHCAVRRGNDKLCCWQAALCAPRQTWIFSIARRLRPRAFHDLDLGHTSIAAARRSLCSDRRRQT